MVMNKSRGRPAGGGGTDTKERIRHEARVRFLQCGYSATTLRSVADAADVDVALISYYYRSKRGLFSAAMALPRGPSQVLAAALDGPPDTLPERLLEAVLRTWDDPELGRPLSALVSLALQDEGVMRSFREYVEREVVTRLAEQLGGPHATERAMAAVAVIVGLVFTRYVLGLRPSADMANAELARALSPSLRVAMQPRRTGMRRPVGKNGAESLGSSARAI